MQIKGISCVISLKSCVFDTGIGRDRLLAVVGRKFFICLRIREFAIFLQIFSIDNLKMLIYLPRFDLEISKQKKPILVNSREMKMGRNRGMTEHLELKLKRTVAVIQTSIYFIFFAKALQISEHSSDQFQKGNMSISTA